MKLQYATLRYTNYYYNHSYYSYKYNYTTLHYTMLDYTTTLNYTTARNTTEHYTTLITPHQLDLQLQYTNYDALQVQLQPQLSYTTLHPPVVGAVTDQVTAAATVTTSKKHNSNRLSVHQWIRFVIRPRPYRFPIFESSAPTLCGTTGINDR